MRMTVSASATGTATSSHAPSAPNSSFSTFKSETPSRRDLTRAEIGKTAAKADQRAWNDLGLFRRPEAGGRRAAISADETTATKQDAAEKARHHRDRAIQSLAVDGLKDRLSGRTARLAIVTEAIGLADAPCPAIVVGGGIRHGGNEGLRLVLARNRRGMGDETALLDILREGFALLEGKHLFLRPPS